MGFDLATYVLESCLVHLFRYVRCCTDRVRAARETDACKKGLRRFHARQQQKGIRGMGKRHHNLQHSDALVVFGVDNLTTAATLLDEMM